MRLLLIIILFPFLGCAQTNKPGNQFSVNIKMDEVKPGDTIYFSYVRFQNGEPTQVTDTQVFKSDNVVFTGNITEPVEAYLLKYRIEKIDTAAQLKMLKELPVPEDMKKEVENVFLNPVKPDEVSLLLLPGETTVKVKRNLRNAKLEGSAALNEYLKLKKDFEKANMEMMLAMRDDDDSDPFSMDSEAQARRMKKYDSVNSITLG